jgi:hypothetical protein
MGGFLKYLPEDARRYLKEDGELLVSICPAKKLI